MWFMRRDVPVSLPHQPQVWLRWQASESAEYNHIVIWMFLSCDEELGAQVEL
jgi:hypothetical protein